MLGLVISSIVLVLLSLALVAGYFLSFFGDQAMDLAAAFPFLAGIACAVALVGFLAVPLDSTSRENPFHASRHRLGLWIPAAFSAVYVFVSWAIGDYWGSKGWADAGVLVAMVMIAVPSISLIWAVWLWSVREKATGSLSFLIVLGVAIPIVVGTIGQAGLKTSAALKESATARQLAGINVSPVEDEMLLSRRGNPIGIRVRYKVRFADGLDDIRYRPTVSLAFVSPHVEMWELRSEITPAVEGRFDKGEYNFVVDFIPAYLPGFMRFPDASQRKTDRCFYWAPLGMRAVATDSVPRRATISLNIARDPRGPSIRRNFQSNAYAQRTFYEGALAEGAIDCH